MSLPVQTTREADAQIREVDDWWRRNRFAAPDLFLDELSASFDSIGHTPQMGRQYRGHGASCCSELAITSTTFRALTR